MSQIILLEELLERDRSQVKVDSLKTWIPSWRATQTRLGVETPFLPAVIAANEADRLAWAFFSGYQGAIQATFPGRTSHTAVSTICVNETGKKITEITTSLKGSRDKLSLDGSKSWSLTGVQDLDMFVLARREGGPLAGPGSLVCVQTSLHHEGVSLNTRSNQNVVPELPHGEARFNEVAVNPAQILPGDGYSDYVKPFRLREDVFVTACTLAYLLGEAREARWPTTWSQKCVAVISSLYACSTLSPHQPDTHILVAGALNMAGELIYETDFLWGKSATGKHGRWDRDFPLLSLGREARRQRVIKSWRLKGWDVPDHTGLGDHISGSLIV